MHGIRAMTTAVVGATLCLSALASGAGAGGTAPAVLRIDRLSGTVVRIGSAGSLAPYAVRLRATVCLNSPAEALHTYMREFRITHYAVRTYKGRTKWWPARTVTEWPPVFVPFGETWKGKACGPATFDDPIPSENYDAVSLGSGCYGVALTIYAGNKQPTRRVIVTCGHRFG